MCWWQLCTFPSSGSQSLIPSLNAGCALFASTGLGLLACLLQLLTLSGGHAGSTLRRSSFDNNVSERKKAQSCAKEISILELVLLGGLKGFARNAGGRIVFLRSLLKKQTLRAESGIEQQEGNKLWELSHCFLAGWGSERCDLVQDVPAHFRGVDYSNYFMVPFQIWSS